MQVDGHYARATERVVPGHEADSGEGAGVDRTDATGQTAAYLKVRLALKSRSAPCLCTSTYRCAMAEQVPRSDSPARRNDSRLTA
jgi:hypothetical protein